MGNVIATLFSVGHAHGVGGKQPDGRKEDPPTWVIGTDKRFHYEKEGHATPAPNAYGMPPSGLGRQVAGRYHTQPFATFCTSGRTHMRKVWISQEHQKIDMHGSDSPGPVVYQLKTTMGKQDESVIPSPASWVFGSAKRTDVEPGKHSPGPAAYGLPQSVGPQPDSRKPRAATPARPRKLASPYPPHSLTPPLTPPLPSPARNRTSPRTTAPTPAGLSTT